MQPGPKLFRAKVFAAPLDELTRGAAQEPPADIVFPIAVEQREDETVALFGPALGQEQSGGQPFDRPTLVNRRPDQVAAGIVVVPHESVGGGGPPRRMRAATRMCWRAVIALSVPRAQRAMVQDS